MISQFGNALFWVLIAIVLVWAVVMSLVTRYLWRNVPTRPMKADYLRVPTNSALTILGLLTPVLVALAAYLYTNFPQGTYTFLLATITVFFMVLFVAIWETFSILRKATITDTIELTMPEDLRFIVGMGWIYSFLLIALIYFSLFFLFELAPPPSVPPQGVGKGDSYYLAKPKAHIDQLKADVVKQWGEPTSANQAGNQIDYDTEQSTVHLQFDATGKLKQIVETRR